MDPIFSTLRHAATMRRHNSESESGDPDRCDTISEESAGSIVRADQRAQKMPYEGSSSHPGFYGAASDEHYSSDGRKSMEASGRQGPNLRRGDSSNY